MSAAPAVGLPALITRAADRFALTDEATPVSSALGLWLLLALVAPAAQGEEREQLQDALGCPSVPRSTTPTSWLERSSDGGRHWVTVAQYNDGGLGSSTWASPPHPGRRHPRQIRDRYHPARPDQRAATDP